jgi:hypothetical protein
MYVHRSSWPVKQSDPTRQGRAVEAVDLVRHAGAAERNSRQIASV